MKKEQPKIKLELAFTDNFLEYSGIALILLLWIFILFNYQTLPDKIPSHFDAEGNINDYAGKEFIWFLPCLSIIEFIGLTIVNKFPHKFNYLVKINPENAERQYKIATRLIRYLKTAIAAVFFGITWFMVKAAKQEISGMEQWFLPVFMAIIFIPLFYFLVQSVRNK